MKRILSWLLSLLGSALILALALSLLPYTGKLLAKIMPDESGSAIKASVVLSSEMTGTARLETVAIEETGTLNYEIKAALLGTVASVNVKYEYRARLGIDLSQVTLRVTGNQLTFVLPEPELFLDSLTPVEIYRNDDLYPYFDDNDFQALLERERQERQAALLSGEKSQEIWDETVRMLDATVSGWLLGMKDGLEIQYTRAE